jgi:ankyrin repeat protein
MSLMIAALEGYVAAIEVLLNRGAQIEAKTNVGDTGLTYAANRG